MRRAQVAVGACLLTLAACGGDSAAPAPESEPGEGAREDRAETGTPPRGAALDARCRRVVRETGLSMRLPVRRAGEEFPAYSRRMRRAMASIARVYRTLHLRLRDLPGTREQKASEPFGSYLTSLDHTAWQFEQAAGGRIRNRIELRSALVYPSKQWQLLAEAAKALQAPGCAPPPVV